jgi:dUTP pyrophosphatase
MAGQFQSGQFQSKNKYTLYINPHIDENAFDNPNDLINHYLNLERISLSTEDSGIDLYIPSNHSFDATQLGTLNHHIRCFMKENASGQTVGYYLYPRSSIHKYALMLANSVGIIDAGYRGDIMAKVRCFKDGTHIEKGSKLFQICAPDLSPLNVKVILSGNEYMAEASVRGNNGFGSSGR